MERRKGADVETRSISMKIIAYDIRELGWRMETKVKEFTLLKNADTSVVNRC